MNFRIEPLLLRILGELDGIFWPFRDFRTSKAGFNAVTEKVARYFDQGLAFKVGGDKSAMVALQRQLEEFESLGWIRVHRANGKRCGVSFTHEGSQFIRMRSCLATSTDSWDWMAKIVKFRKPIVRENDLLPKQTRSHRKLCLDLTSLQIDLLPLMADGFVRSVVDTAGHVGYGLTDLGILRLSEPPEQETLEEYDDDASQANFAIYDEVFKLTLKERIGWDTDSNVVAVPLGAGSW